MNVFVKLTSGLRNLLYGPFWHPLYGFAAGLYDNETRRGDRSHGSQRTVGDRRPYTRSTYSYAPETGLWRRSEGA